MIMACWRKFLLLHDTVGNMSMMHYAILKSEVTALQFIHLFRVTDCNANSIPPLILRL